MEASLRVQYVYEARREQILVKRVNRGMIDIMDQPEMVDAAAYRVSVRIWNYMDSK